MWSISQPKWSFREHLPHVMRLLEIAKVLRSLQKNLSQPCGSEIPVLCILAPARLPEEWQVFICLLTAVAHCRPPTDQAPHWDQLGQNSTTSKVFTWSGPRNTWSGHTSLSVAVQSKSRWHEMPRNPGVTPWGAPSKGRHSPGLVHFRMAVWMSPEPPACKENTVNCC